ncbi:hypothetical protein [Jiangella sp. DSM 45060]|uniref:hypothetical protein n=1 Tax=Jiangella sp. DSM 45060 TaxID=1798224 RepID=UPI000879F821|nr:hypothetical protein [Jiangella sp. DSM 45060]SDS70526.1 hypothetical protein SAMN04515669_1717 [Jiangella sp. DSM 45060]
MSLQTRYEFVLPRGYVDGDGALHRTGTMRLATARDELEPLRDPMVDGPDDPRLTILVLARVVETLGSLELVTAHEIENLFAVDLAFLQDFYGVINFGSQDDYEALLQSQQELLGPVTASASAPAGPEVTEAAGEPVAVGAPSPSSRVPRPGRSAIEELPGVGR